MGDIPNVKYEEDIVFMIYITVHWKDDPELLKQICLIDFETMLDSQLITIICESQQFIVEKAKKLGVVKWMFNYISIKPSGCVAIDVQPCFMRFHPKAKKSNLGDKESRKYPGVYVFLPIKGFKNKHPVTGLDFTSLYPSLIITYNLSSDKIILSQKYAESLRDSGKILYEINFKFNGNNVLAWSIRYNNIPEKKGLMDKDLSLPEVIEHVLTKAEEKKYASLNKNLYYFINKEKHEFIAEYDSVYMISFYDTARDKEMEKLRDEVNKFLRKDNKSPYHKMVYEKVLFPVVFTGKKNTMSSLFCKVERCIMDEFMKVNNLRTLHQIIEDVLMETNNSSQKVRDKMEYPEVTRQLGKKIDINYYLKSIIELYARFINYDDRYQLSFETLLQVLKKLKDE
ncbi:1284_t:CDS:10, partial [Funneliformis geosporum]